MKSHPVDVANSKNIVDNPQKLHLFSNLANHYYN